MTEAGPHRVIALSNGFLVTTEGLDWDGASHPKANVEASGEAEGFGQTKGLNIQETQCTFPPGLGCPKLPCRCRCTVAEPRERGWAARGAPRAGQPSARKVRRAGPGEPSSWPTTPLYVGLISPTDLSPLSCQAKYFGLAGGAERTERSRQTNPFGLGAGRARAPVCAAGDTAASGAGGRLGA